MTRTRKALVGTGVVVVLGAILMANLKFSRTAGVEVTTEKVTTRDLEAVVSASGTIQPIRSVNVGAEAPGRVVDLQFREGDIVTQGQFLLQVDPRNMQIQADSQSSGLEMARSQLEETRKAVESARVSLAQSKTTFDRQASMFARGLLPRADYETAENNMKIQESQVAQLEQSLKTQQTRITQQESLLQNAQYDLSKTRITSPINGVITKRSVELGEMVAGSTFSPSNLLTVADMSIVRAEIQVDETDIPNVKIGQPAKVTIDAIPDQTFTGKVTELGNSPIQATGASATTRATDFKVVVTLDREIKGVRPGFTASAAITTATRQKAITVPIQASTVREMIVDKDGGIVRPEGPGRAGQGPVHRTSAPAPTAELPPGQMRKEIEGVFVVRDGKAVFTPMKAGIAGEKYFEVLSGLQPGDEVITGPFASVRSMKDGDAVKVGTTPATAATPAKS